MDCILVERAAGDGRPIGVHFFIGLFSAATYNRSARNIPLLRRKLTRALASAGFEPRSHDGRALRQHHRDVPARRAVPGDR